VNEPRRKGNGGKGHSKRMFLQANPEKRGGSATLQGKTEFTKERGGEEEKGLVKKVGEGGCGRYRLSQYDRRCVLTWGVLPRERPSPVFLTKKGGKSRIPKKKRRGKR